MQKIIVPLKERSYPIHIGSGLLDSLGAYVREALGEITVAVVTDDNIAPLVALKPRREDRYIQLIPVLQRLLVRKDYHWVVSNIITVC